MPLWFDELPGLDDKTRRKARAIAERRLEAEKEVLRARGAERDLFIAVARTGDWTRHEIAEAMLLLEFAVVQLLPDDLLTTLKSKRRR